MKKGFSHIIVLIGILLLTAGCSNYQKLLKSTNVDEKYAAALKYYEKEDYYRANQLLNDVLPLLGGRPEGERARFLFAHTHFMQREFLLSAYQFQLFYETYPRSEFAEEAIFLYAKSQYMSSPGYEQDQSTTVTALESLLEFQARFPTSQFAEETNNMINELNVKLDRKSFDSARLYYQLRYYKSAVVSLTNFINEHAGSPYSEEAAFLRLDAQYRFALESVVSKQQERFTEAADFYLAFIDLHPQGKFLRDAEKIYENTLSELDKLKQPTQVSQGN
ncbi:outer membrane protein assembly factor BamD [Pontibacter qinzhouensis]|uniref:Outer membrane protein assembly factor BamD n=1 Tax=Pontibacter qinzhouensis TaxID=2603253 RepID=A0A5C8KCT7_9BACT|nr:outer membrane protein assembly factor BamD [Pontibacter qinzhouensis]TXK52075.1 outer membrane protein assembly factor BamD [Pontibacter qinzhouensis]